MGRLFANLTPEQEQSLVEERRDFQYSKAWSSPLVWQERARLHKRAADILYETGYRAHERYTTRLLAELTEAKGAWTDGVVSRTLEGEELEDKLDMDLIGDYLLLAGYALECILKGCLVVMQPGLLENKKQRDRVIVTHDLCQLCRDCGITLTPEESQLLDLIKRYIRWGKYPAPRKPEDMPSWMDPEDQKTKSLSNGNPFHQRREQSLVNGVFQRGLDLLDSLRNSQP